MPELVTTLVSTFRGQRDVAIGNLIGSSVYNLTLILGVPVLVANGSGPIDTYLLHIDLPIMVGFGVKTAAMAAAIGRIADGVVVATALIDQFETLRRSKSKADFRLAAAKAVADIRQALDP